MKRASAWNKSVSDGLDPLPIDRKLNNIPRGGGRNHAETPPHNPPDPVCENARGIQRLNAWRNWNIIQYATPATGQMIHVISQCIVTKLESR